MPETMMLVNRLDRKSDLFAMFSSEQRHNAKYEGGVDIRLHIYINSSGIAPCCQ